jgi:hypothetical protein
VLIPSFLTESPPEPAKNAMCLASSNLWALIPCEVWVKTLKPFTENLARENHIKLARELREREIIMRERMRKYINHNKILHGV